MPDVDYGDDIDCVSDIGFDLRKVDGLTAVAQACARRLITKRGFLWYDPDYGYDVRQFLSGVLIPTNSINGNIENELMKDKRVDDVEASAAYEPATEKLTISVAGSGAAGPFDFTLLVGSVTVELLREGTV